MRHWKRLKTETSMIISISFILFYFTQDKRLHNILVSKHSELICYIKPNTFCILISLIPSCTMMSMPIEETIRGF